MKVLLDTHTLLWFAAGDSQLSDAARAAIEAPENEAVVSVASLWEMAIKISLGKLDLGMSLDEFVADHSKHVGTLLAHRKRKGRPKDDPKSFIF